MCEKTAMFGMICFGVVWAFRKLGWTQYFRIIAGITAFLLGMWTGQMWTGLSQMNSDVFRMTPLCIIHTVLFAASILASSYAHNFKAVTAWAVTNGMFIIHYWITYYVSKNLAENYQENEMIAQTMENTRSIYIPATVADICLVILPVVYRSLTQACNQHQPQKRDVQNVFYKKGQNVKKERRVVEVLPRPRGIDGFRDCVCEYCRSYAEHRVRMPSTGGRTNQKGVLQSTEREQETLIERAALKELIANLQAEILEMQREKLILNALLDQRAERSLEKLQNNTNRLIHDQNLNKEADEEAEAKACQAQNKVTNSSLMSHSFLSGMAKLLELRLNQKKAAGQKQRDISVGTKP